MIKRDDTKERPTGELEAVEAESRLAADQIEHLNLVLRAVRAVNRLITTEKDRDRLLKKACKTLVYNRGYYNAWIAILDKDRGLVTSAQAGLGRDFLSMLKRLKQSKLTGCAQRALTQPEPVVIEDPVSACTDCPLIGKYGGRGAMTCRIAHGGEVYGLLSLSIPRHLAKSEDEQILVREITEDIALALHTMELERAREQAEENIRIYAHLVTQAQEEERKRLARELHDDTAQELSSLSLDIDILLSSPNALAQDVASQLEDFRRRISSVLEGVRRFSQDLRPSVLEDFGLLAGLQWIVDDLTDRSTINGTLEVLGSKRRLSSPTELVLFRIAQEALSNVRRHSKATRALVQLEFGPHKTVMRIVDNGQGMEIPRTLDGFVRLGKLGIAGMHERAHLINGGFTMESQRNKGTKLTLEVNE